MTGGLTMYMSELQEPSDCFLKNMHKGYAGTCWRKCGATAMVNKGESAINLKHVGGWQSNKVVQGYIAQSKHIKTAQVGALEGTEKPIVEPQVSPKKQKVAEKFISNPTVEKGTCDDAMNVLVTVKSSCGVDDGAASEGDDSCKLTEWAVCRTVVINNYYVSPSKKEE
eukprot:5516170-Ditylum_brightwellii.AAC.1